MSELDEAQVERRWRRRHAAARRFRWYGVFAISIAMLALAMLLVRITTQGITGFVQHEVVLDVSFDAVAAGVEMPATSKELRMGNYAAWVRASLGDLFPEVTERKARRQLSSLVSSGAAYELRDRVVENPRLLGTVQRVRLPLDDDADLLFKGSIRRDVDETERKLSDAQIAWLDRLVEQDRIERSFNWRFFRGGDSREPELAGIWGATVGSFLTLGMTLLLAFPIGVATAVYLEEFAPKKSRWMDVIEVNINNLAAVPSIVFGLLGLAVFLNVFGLPRSAPLVGGLVLALMTLPTIIIASRAAIQAVPPSIREAAFGVGASKLQVVMHHVLPLAMPGIMTGTILGMAQALGETAPLLMIGMVAFMVEIPTGWTSPATILPVQIFLWADSPERGFVEKASAAILVLIAFLIAMNLVAVVLRKRFERQW